MRVLLIFLFAPFWAYADLPSDTLTSPQIHAFFRLTVTAPADRAVFSVVLLDNFENDYVVLTPDESIILTCGDNSYTYVQNKNLNIPYVPDQDCQLTYKRYNGEVLTSKVQMIRQWNFTSPLPDSLHLRDEPLTFTWSPVPADRFEYVPTVACHSIRPVLSVDLTAGVARYPAGYDANCPELSAVALELILIKSGTSMAPLGGEGFSSQYDVSIKFNLAPDSLRGI